MGAAQANKARVRLVLNFSDRPAKLFRISSTRQWHSELRQHMYNRAHTHARMHAHTHTRTHTHTHTQTQKNTHTPTYTDRRAITASAKKSSDINTNPSSHPVLQKLDGLVRTANTSQLFIFTHKWICPCACMCRKATTCRKAYIRSTLLATHATSIKYDQEYRNQSVQHCNWVLDNRIRHVCMRRCTHRCMPWPTTAETTHNKLLASHFLGLWKICRRTRSRSGESTSWLSAVAEPSSLLVETPSRSHAVRTLAIALYAYCQAMKPSQRRRVAVVVQHKAYQHTK